eukprot:258935_1
MENGIIITINNDKASSAYIYCPPWSDYPHESECLFEGGFSALTIIGLTHIPSSCDYSIYIGAMQLFNKCINGDASTNGVKVKSKHSNIINKLIK